MKSMTRFKPLFKRFLIAAIVFPPMVAMTNEGETDKVHSRKPASVEKTVKKVEAKKAEKPVTPESE